MLALAKKEYQRLYEGNKKLKDLIERNNKEKTKEIGKEKIRKKRYKKRQYTIEETDSKVSSEIETEPGEIKKPKKKYQKENK